MAALGQSEDNNEADQRPTNFLDSNTFEVVLVFGVLLTAVVAFVAVNMRRLRITKSGFLCILIGAGDFSSDVVFARHAIRNGKTPLLRLLPLGFVIAPFLLSTIRCSSSCSATRSSSTPPSLRATPASMAACSCSRSPTSRCSSSSRGARPNTTASTSRLLALTFFTTFAEDIPQTVLQLTYLLVDITKPDAITIISLASLCSIWWRGFRKLIIVLFVKPEKYPAQMLAGRSFRRASLAFAGSAEIWCTPPGAGGGGGCGGGGGVGGGASGATTARRLESRSASFPSGGSVADRAVSMPVCAVTAGPAPLRAQQAAGPSFAAVEGVAPPTSGRNRRRSSHGVAGGRAGSGQTATRRWLAPRAPRPSARPAAPAAWAPRSARCLQRRRRSPRRRPPCCRRRRSPEPPAAADWLAALGHPTRA